MWLTLPIINAVSLQDFLDLVANFHLSSITDELSGWGLGLDLLLKSFYELPISLNGINIGHEGLHTNKNFGNGDTRVNSWGI